MGWPMESVGWDIQETWVDSAANAVAWGIFTWSVFVATVVLLAMLVIRTRRRHFWCDGARCEVDVMFEDRGFPGFRKTTILSCSALDPPTALGCHRDCLDPSRRFPASIARQAA